MKEDKDLNKLQNFLIDLLQLVESKGYEDYVVDAFSKVLAMSAIESGIDTVNNDAEVFTAVVVNGEPKLANIKITTDMVSLTDRYVANGINNPVHGEFYVCSKNTENTLQENTSNDEQAH